MGLAFLKKQKETFYLPALQCGMGRSCLQKNQIAVYSSLSECREPEERQRLTLGVISNSKIPQRGGAGSIGKQNPAGVKSTCQRRAWGSKRRLGHTVVPRAKHKIQSHHLPSMWEFVATTYAPENSKVMTVPLVAFIELGMYWNIPPLVVASAPT